MINSNNKRKKTHVKGEITDEHTIIAMLKINFEATLQPRFEDKPCWDPKKRFRELSELILAFLRTCFLVNIAAIFPFLDNKRAKLKF